MVGTPDARPLPRALSFNGFLTLLGNNINKWEF
jgi:hypothetical protein